jgi:predicted transcriptional regulator of viral defense system
MISTAAGISRQGRAELAAVLGSGKRFITPDDVAGALGVGPGAAAARLSRWAREGWLRRVRRGLYIGVPADAADPGAWSEDALVVAAAVWTPCYFTGWTAAGHWALSEQVFRTTVLKTVGRVRASHARLLDHDYLLAHASGDAMHWGVRSEWRGEARLRFADPARTVIDILSNPELAGGIRHAAEITSAYLDEHEPGTLIDYGDRSGNRAIFKRLGYLTEALGLDVPHLTEACAERVSAGISALEPGGAPGGRRSMRWGLRLNMTITPQEPS